MGRESEGAGERRGGAPYRPGPRRHGELDRAVRWRRRRADRARPCSVATGEKRERLTEGPTVSDLAIRHFLFFPFYSADSRYLKEALNMFIKTWENSYWLQFTFRYSTKIGEVK